MTLDIAQYLKNAIKKEAKISHFNVYVEVGTPKKLKSDIHEKILNDEGELFLSDANYIVIFKKAEGWEKNDANILFSLVNRALGKNANSLAKSDFKPIELSEDNPVLFLLKVTTH